MTPSANEPEKTWMDVCGSLPQKPLVGTYQSTKALWKARTVKCSNKEWPESNQSVKNPKNWSQKALTVELGLREGFRKGSPDENGRSGESKK